MLDIPDNDYYPYLRSGMTVDEKSGGGGGGRGNWNEKRSGLEKGN